MINLSKDQKRVLNDLLGFATKPGKQYITLGGYAGTGKTTLIAVLRKKLYRDGKKSGKKLKVAFCSYTGKATRVLKDKLRKARAIYSGDSVSTIHGLIYSPIENERKEIVGWQRKDSIDCDLIIVDEASMVDEEIWRDLLWFNVPIIAVGDHGQLPPIRGKFNLMEEPELTLESIHRQARDNPIIKLSIIARNRGLIPIGEYGEKVKKYNKRTHETSEYIEELLNNWNEKTMILSGYNRTRIKLNNHIRGTKGIENEIPEPGDRVICLRNNHEKMIYNGMLGVLKKINKEDENWYSAEIQMDGERSPYTGLISTKQFNQTEPLNFTEKRSEIMKGDLFDFGYALTVHKAQGSESEKVILFEERFRKMDDDTWTRWLYTAVTRAINELYIIGE